MLALGACAAPSTTVSQAQAAGNCDLSNFLAVQHAHVNRAEVTLCGSVTRVRSVRTGRSGAHRDFVVEVGHNDTIEIDANVDVMGDFPISSGEKITVRGEYYYDGGGREGVHFTHHARGGRHESGYLILAGRRYE